MIATDKTAVRRSERVVFAVGAVLLLLLIAWPSIGAVLVRSMPPEVDDSLFYLVRGQYLLECPREDCPGTESIRTELAEKTGNPDVDVNRAYHRFVILGIHAPIQIAFLATLRAAGLDWMTTLWVFVFIGIAVIATGVCLWLRAIFGPGPAGIAAVLVGTTYFVGQGFIWIVPSNVTIGLGFLASGIAALKRRDAAVWVAVLLWVIVFMHITGRGVAAIVIVTYLTSAGFPWSRSWRDLIPVVSGIAAIVLYTALPLLFDRPDFRIPFGMEALQDNPLDVILLNVIETMRVTFRTTSIAGGFVPMLAVTIVGTLMLPPTQRLPAAAMLIAAGGLCVFSLFHISPRIPAELFARIWIFVAVTMTGCAALVLWRAIPLVAGTRLELWPLWQSSMGDLQRILTPAGWRLAAIAAVAVLAFGAVIHTLVGLYAVERLRVMITARHDFAFERQQPAVMLADGCKTVYYSRAEALHAYWLYGALRCRSLIDIGLDRKALADSRDISHAVAFNPMAQFQNWPPLRRGEPFVIRNDSKVAEGCPAHDASANVHVRLRGERGEGAIKIVKDGSAKSVTVGRDPEWIDLGPVNSSAEIEGDRVSIGGIRRGAPDGLAWPWDQGLEIEFVRDIPYQSRNKVVEQFRTNEHFPFGRCVQVLDDRGLTVLARGS